MSGFIFSIYAHICQHCHFSLRNIFFSFFFWKLFHHFWAVLLYNPAQLMRPHCNINDINVFCLAFAMAKCPNVQIEIKKRKKNFWQFGTIQRGKRIITSRISKQMVQYFTSHKSWDLIFPFRMLLLLLYGSLSRSLFLSEWLLLEYIRFPMDWLFTYCIYTWSFVAIMGMTVAAAAASVATTTMNVKHIDKLNIYPFYRFSHNVDFIRNGKLCISQYRITAGFKEMGKKSTQRHTMS